MVFSVKVTNMLQNAHTNTVLKWLTINTIEFSSDKHTLNQLAIVFLQEKIPVLVASSE